MPDHSLRELGAEFLRFESAGRYAHVDSIAEASGVSFLCPACFERNGGRRGTHTVICWSRSRGVPDGVVPGPGRWAMLGTGLDDLTLNGDAAVPGGGARSVKTACWHGYITAGKAITPRPKNKNLTRR